MDRYILHNHIIFILKWQKHNTFSIISIDQWINKLAEDNKVIMLFFPLSIQYLMNQKN